MSAGAAPSAAADLRFREPVSRIVLGLLGYSLGGLLVLFLVPFVGVAAAGVTILFDDYERSGPIVGALTMLALAVYVFAKTRMRIGGTLLLRGDGFEVGPRFWPVRIAYAQVVRVVSAPVGGKGMARLVLTGEDFERAFHLLEADAASCERALRARAVAAGGLREKVPSAPVLDGGDGQPGIPLAPRPAEEIAPDGIVEGLDGLSWPWSASIGVTMLLVLLLPADAFLALVLWRGQELGMLLLLLAQVAVTYGALAYVINRTHLTVRDGVLHVRPAGVPWPALRARAIPARDIARVYVAVRIVRSHKSSTIHHNLKVVDRNWVETDLGRLPSADHAAYVERWLAKALQVPSGPSRE